MKRVSVKIDVDLYEYLKKMSEVNGLTIAGLASRYIEDGIEADRKLNGLHPCFSKGRED